jgi:hypothetical protein
MIVVLILKLPSVRIRMVCICRDQPLYGHMVIREAKVNKEATVLFKI